MQLKMHKTTVWKLKRSSAILSIKSRHTKYWTNLSKSCTSHLARGALMLRLERYREKSTSHIFKRYSRLRRKHSLLSGMYIQEIYTASNIGAYIWQRYASQNICILSLLATPSPTRLLSSVNDHKQLSMAISRGVSLRISELERCFTCGGLMSHRVSRNIKQ